MPAHVRSTAVKARGGSIALSLAMVIAGIIAAPGAFAQGLPSTIAAAHPELREAGGGRFRYFGFHVYDARLWIAGNKFDAGHSFVLGLKYARGFSGAAIASQSVAEIKRLIASDLPPAWIDALQNAFPDVAAGDELHGVHVPGEGARIFHNGRRVGSLSDPTLARRFFDIWLDARTREPQLRAALLGTE